MEEEKNQRKSMKLRSSKKQKFKTTPYKKIVDKPSGDRERKKLSTNFHLSINDESMNHESNFEIFFSKLTSRKQSKESLISKNNTKWTNFVTDVQDFQLNSGPEALITANSTKMSNELDNSTNLQTENDDVTTPEFLSFLHSSITTVNTDQLIESENIVVEGDNIEECSPTSSSTPIKDGQNLTSHTENNDLIYFENTNASTQNISNEIILIEETTEKVMKLLEESMQVYDEDGQLKSLKDIGRIQVSFLYEGECFL